MKREPQLKTCLGQAGLWLPYQWSILLIVNSCRRTQPTVGGATPGQVVLEKRASRENKQVSSVPAVFATILASRFLSSAPALLLSLKLK